MKFPGLLLLTFASTILATPLANSQNQGQPIHFNNLKDKCLTVRNSVFAYGTPVQINDCNNSQAQRWVINEGSTKVQVAGTNFCLDNGAVLANGAQPTISQCRDDLSAQKWYYKNNHIELKGRGLCIERGNGILASSYKVQTWICSYTNNNQVWTL